MPNHFKKIQLKDFGRVDFIKFEISYSNGDKFKIQRDNENDI